MEHWEVVTATTTYCFYVFVVLEILRRIRRSYIKSENGLIHAIKKFVFLNARRLPYVGGKIKGEIEKAKDDLKATLFDMKGQGYKKVLPYKPMHFDQIKNEVSKYKDLATTEWSDGLCSGTVYYCNEKLTDLMVDVYREHVWSNPLHSDIFPDVRKMEAEVVSMCVSLFNGDSDKACGVMSSGGTESIMLAVKAYREVGVARGVQRCEIVAAKSVHPAFDKAAHYLGMKICHVDVNSDGTANVKAMKKIINKNTVLLVGSAPSFPHGCMDPIEDLAKLAHSYNIGFHTDACLGGFLLPFMSKAGYPVAPFDFAVKGVTSISADTHKYGFSPKGSSVVLFSNIELRKHLYFVQSDWSGGVYASPTIPGSRPGNAVATTWASLLYHGQEGYIETTKKVVETTKYLAENLAKIPGISLLGKPDVCVVAITSKAFDIFLLSELLCEKKWKLSPLQFPSGLHLSVTMLHAAPGVADRLIADVNEAAEHCMKTPDAKCGGQGAIYGMSQQIPDRSVIGEICQAYLDTYYSCSTSTTPKNVSNGSFANGKVANGNVANGEVH